MENTNFLKIVYFDEAFVADFMQIIAGGELKKTTEFITEVNSGIEGSTGAEGGIGTEKNALSMSTWTAAAELPCRMWWITSSTSTRTARRTG